jgi:hypothetical protein
MAGRGHGPEVAFSGRVTLPDRFASTEWFSCLAARRNEQWGADFKIFLMHMEIKRYILRNIEINKLLAITWATR